MNESSLLGKMGANGCVYVWVWGSGSIYIKYILCTLVHNRGSEVFEVGSPELHSAFLPSGKPLKGFLGL